MISKIKELVANIKLASIISNAISSYFSKKQLFIYALIAVFSVSFSFFIYFKFIHDPTPRLVEINDTSSQSVQAGLAEVGHNVSANEAKDISEAIKDKEGKPDSTATFESKNEADNWAKNEGKKDSADVVLGEPEKPSIGSSNNTGSSISSGNTTANYYGIHYEKKNALGIYADADRDGSIGLSYRHDRVALDVGKKYKDGDLTARVHWEAIKF